MITLVVFECDGSDIIWGIVPPLIMFFVGLVIVIIWNRRYR